MEATDGGKEIIGNTVITEIPSQFLIQRLPENGQLLATDLLQNHNGLVVDLGGNDFIPVNYSSEDLLAQDLTEEDRNLAAALVAVQLNQQQKQQQGQEVAVSAGTLQAVNQSGLGVDHQLILTEKNNPGFLQIVGTDEMYVGKNNLPKLSLEDDAGETNANSEPPEEVSTIKLENDSEKRDSDGETETKNDGRSSKKNLPHKKRISRKLNKKTDKTASKKLKCNLCEQTFTSSEDFHQHQVLCQTTITPVNVQSFGCQLCTRTFSDQLKFFEHLKAHYEPGAEKLGLINEKESSVPLPLAEPKEEEKESVLSSILNLTCLECNKTFRKQKTYEHHLREFHSKDEMNEFSEPEDLMDGINVVVDNEDHLSDNDDKEWYKEEDLQQTEEDLKELEAVEHVCHLCQQPFPLRAILLQHLITCRATTGVTEPTAPVVVKKKNKTKKNATSLECTQCERVFTHRNSLMYHMRSHSGVRPHQCEQCGKSFFASSALKVHLRLHTGVKPYHCDQCGRDFRQWGDLKYHTTSIHSTEKAFQCEYCGKDFARKYSLVVHRRIHTGERNYKCEFCGKTFRASSYLHNHRRIHTGEKPHTCEVCGKPFRVRSDMKRHLKTHRKRRPSPATKSNAMYTTTTITTNVNTKKEIESNLSDTTSDLHINEAEYITEAITSPIKNEGTLYTNGHQLFLVSYASGSPNKAVETAWIPAE